MSNKLAALYSHGVLKPHHIEKMFRETDAKDIWDDSPHAEATVNILRDLKNDYKPEIASAILRSGNEEAITQIAHNKNAPYNQLSHLVDHPSTEIKSAMLYRTDLPKEEFNKLANHFIDHEEDKRPALGLYGEKNYHPDTIEKILKHPDIDHHSKLKFLSSNRNVKPETLEHYGMHGTGIEKAHVAENLYTPPHVLEHLAKHGDENALFGVAHNYSTPEHVLMNIPTW